MKNLTKQQLIHRQEPGKRWIRRESGYIAIAPCRVTNMDESSSINSCCRKGLKKMVKIFSCLCVQQYLAFNFLSSVFCVRFIVLKVTMSIVATPVTFNDVLTSRLNFMLTHFRNLFWVWLSTPMRWNRHRLPFAQPADLLRSHGFICAWTTNRVTIKN